MHLLNYGLAAQIRLEIKQGKSASKCFVCPLGLNNLKSKMLKSTMSKSQNVKPQIVEPQNAEPQNVEIKFVQRN
jgi:hypothetical protein